MPAYYLKESVHCGHKQYWERAIYRRPFPTLEIAQKAMEKAHKPDNQPYIADEHNTPIITGKKGNEYGD